MSADSIEAYDPPERARTYDADMDIMHPLRHKMIDVALDVLPFPPADTLKVLDLGVGTGAFSLKLLDRFPNSEIVAIDGSSSMLELARARLHEHLHRVELVVSDFRAIPETLLEPDTFDVVISSYALHHLDADDKAAVLGSVVAALKTGGWLLNADLVVANSPDVEERIQQIRVEAVTERAPMDDQRFSSSAATRQHLRDLEEAEQDQPLTLSEDLRVIRDSGIGNAEVVWKEFREAVICGSKADLA
ncbi:MAG: class I SAM-dependent methyltransferase [Woeseiaceae bacterium]|nr:class I SAM-dependent methyltransferase [Woeseiaceae bacterium]